MTASVFGRHEAVGLYGQRIGGIVEIRKNEWIPACIGCYRPLPARGSRLEAKAALREHWTATHARRRAA